MSRLAEFQQEALDIADRLGLRALALARSDARSAAPARYRDFGVVRDREPDATRNPESLPFWQQTPDPQVSEIVPEIALQSVLGSAEAESGRRGR